MNIEITLYKFDSNNVPILKDNEIENIVNLQLNDYDKDYFLNPYTIDVDEFVEFYLKKNIYFYPLPRNILGITALNDGWITIIRDGCEEPLFMKSGDICIDERLCKNEELYRFTLAHEIGHSMLHTKKSIKIPNLEDYKNTIITSKKNLVSSQDWIEHHANIYASCLLMQKEYVKRLFKVYYVIPKRPIGGYVVMDNDEMLHKIAKELKVSFSALRIRLKNLGLL